MSYLKFYKKSFEIEEIKVGKSNKNTNYNTNQSKNSSSLYNSHGYSALGEHSNRNRGKIEEKNQYWQNSKSYQKVNKVVSVGKIVVERNKLETNQKEQHFKGKRYKLNC